MVLNMIRVNLSMFSFKKNIVFVEIMGIIISFMVLNKCMNYILVDDTYSYTRIMLHEMYTQEQNIDTLFLGSSHCYRTFDTSITDGYLGNTFNAGSSSQALDGSYALLVEAGKRNNLKRVFLEMYHEIVVGEYKERTELTSTYIISDYLRPSFNKYQYILNASTREYWINSLFPARRNWKNIFNKDIIANNIRSKKSEPYINYGYVNHGNEYYAGKGYVANTGILNINDYKEAKYASIKQEHISKDNLSILKKIIKYCKQNEIELVLLVVPMPEFRIDKVGNYGYYAEQIEDLANSEGIEFYDFNLCKEEYKFENEYFIDDHHLNKSGAEKFSLLFSRFYVGEIKEEEVFSN